MANVVNVSVTWTGLKRSVFRPPTPNCTSIPPGVGDRASTYTRCAPVST